MSKDAFSEMWEEYKRVILHSLITSFGLDFIVKDQNGGDVDTIHNVRETGEYKNQQNRIDYDNRGKYDSATYHQDETYRETVREVREKHEFFEDAYVPGNTIYYGKHSGLATNRKANLDHVIAAHEIHDDKGRVLAGLSGEELANTSTNLKFTNENLNKSMGDMSIEEYIEKREKNGHPLPEDVKSRMREHDTNARKEYNNKIAKTYYTSEKFLRDAEKAAIKRGFEMGIRQALGFVFLEIWVSCEQELKKLDNNISFGDCMKAIKNGIENGLKNALTKYKGIFRQFSEGFIQGVLASISTTLINIFITTDKEKVRFIRQFSVIVVQAGDIILINPDDLLLGEQLKATIAVITAGVGTIIGTYIGNLINKTPLGTIEGVGEIIERFLSVLVSGLFSCTVLIMIDRSKYINNIIDRLNNYGSFSRSLKELSKAYKNIAIELSKYDIDSFEIELNNYETKIQQLIYVSDEELSIILEDLFIDLHIDTPWTGDFDTFMSDKNNCLVFD